MQLLKFWRNLNAVMSLPRLDANAFGLYPLPSGARRFNDIDALTAIEGTVHVWHAQQGFSGYKEFLVVAQDQRMKTANDTSRFLVGTQYYRAPTPRPEDWERDLANIRERGMNIIRLWLVWAWMNPAKGQFDYSDIETLLGLAKKNDIEVVLLTSLEAAPAWLIHDHPECHYVSRQGLPRYTSCGANLTTGGFPGLCPDHQVVRDYATEWLAATAKHFSGYDNVYGWEPQNEPMMEGARYHDEVYCYCPGSLDRFRGWLKRKYETIENLDAAWRQRHSAWEQVLPPREGGSWPDWVDFRNFALDNIVEHIRWRKQAIAENAPNHRILMHGRANTGAQLDTNTQCIDDWRLSELVDLYGQAAFPGGYQDLDYPLSLEVTRTVSKGKTWWQAELQGGGHARGTIRPYELDGEKLNFWSWMSLAYGAKAVLYWQYRPERMGYEYGYGLTALDGGPSSRTEAVAAMSKVLQKHAELFNAATEPVQEIGLISNPNTNIIHGVSEGEAYAPIDAFRGVYGTLVDQDLGADILRADEEIVDDDYSPYRVIYLPLPTWISPRTAEKLRAFVEQGGTLISEASLGQWDAEYLASTRIPGFGMDEVFAVERAEGQILSVDATELHVGDTVIPSRYYREILVPKGAEVIGTHPDGRAAITRNAFGKGQAIYIGSNPFMEYYHNPNEALLSWVRQFNAPVKRAAYTDRREVFARTLHQGDKTIVFLLNLTAEPQQTVLTVTDDKRSPVELITEEKVDAKPAGNDTAIRINLPSQGVRCYLFG